MDNSNTTEARVRLFFGLITERPKTIILLGTLLIILFSAFLPLLEKDTRADAFAPLNHPALLLSKKTREIFGLGDPMVIAIVNEGEHGIFNPHTLELVAWLTREIENIDNIDPDGITSLSTENNIVGTFEGMEIAPFFEESTTTLAGAQAVKTAVMGFPLYVGTLVAEDGSGTLIIAEMLDSAGSESVYAALLDLAARAPVNSSEIIHIAGVGAITGYIGQYIDDDVAWLIPTCTLVIVFLCFVAFGTLRGAVLPGFVALATLVAAVGLMAAFGVKFFIITSAMPVILIGIAVADSLHILTEYYDQVARNPLSSSRDLSVNTMVRIWRPVTLTSLTTMAGFFGLSIASIMPPMKYFGLFALVGVAMAWIYSLVVIPAILSMIKPQLSKAYSKGASSVDGFSDSSESQVDIFGKAVTTLGVFSIRFPYLVIGAGIALAIAGMYGGARIQLDESLTRAFSKEEPIIIAETAINKAFDGTNFLNIMIETPEVEGLFKPENLRKMEQLQEFLEAHPNVRATTSIVDYLKQMNRSMNADDPEAYRLPDDPEVIAQYFLLYSAIGDPTDFEEEIDYDYRLANIRVNVSELRYSIVKPVIEDLNAYAASELNNDEFQVFVSGRANVNYHWMKRLGSGHFVSIAVALSLVLMMAALSFRSLYAGLFCLIPVLVTVLGIYAYMAVNGIWLSVTSSMFASIAIGLGVDFAIHTVERLQTAIRHFGDLTDQSLIVIYSTTGRALLFNFLALAMGFGTLLLSKTIILQEFGFSIAISVTISFLASLTLLPSLAKVLRPKFLGFEKV